MKRNYDPLGQRGGVMQIASLSAPAGGWNTRDALNVMPADDAITLDNLVPSPGSVESRGGYREYATGLITDVETLVEYYSGTTRKFIGAAGTKIYDITNQGAAVELATGFTSARWDSVGFSARTILVNGVDTPQYYDGSTIQENTFTGTDLTPENLVGITAFKNRLFLWENNSQHFWYAGLNNVQGALTKFPLSRLGKLGGKLISIATLSRDTGTGINDFIAFIMTYDIFVYEGSDPGDSANWNLVGRFPISETISDRAVLEYGGDIKIVTKSDIISLLDLITLSPDQVIKSKLSGAFSTAARLYSDNFGWQAIFYARGNYMLFNIPLVTNSTYHQYGINTITGGAFRFKGWNARCFGLYNNRLYFGGNGIVYLADDGATDDGNDIEIVGQKAFAALGSPKRKRITQIRPIIKVDGGFTMTLGLAFDYGDVFITQTAATVVTGSPWDTSPWNITPWSPETFTRTDVYGASGVGQTVSTKIACSLNGQTFEWYQTDLGFKILNNFS